jgi:hypothetical protein
MVLREQRSDERAVPAKKQSIWDETPETSEAARQGRKVAARLLEDLEARLSRVTDRDRRARRGAQ